MASIKLNLINKSNDQNNSDVVIFQTNQNPDWCEETVAWTVIKNCGQTCNHPFEYPMDMTVNANDSFGNYTPQIAAQNGQQFSMTYTDSGDVFGPTGIASTNPNEVQCLNSLPAGAIGVNIYKDVKLLATVSNVVPAQMAVFEFIPKIYVSVLSNVVEGSVMKSADVTSQNSLLDLTGLASADIIMTGGGGGQTATAYTFTLANKVMAQ